jgi:uncharacterized protein YlxW (UPF0749 family)
MEKRIKYQQFQQVKSAAKMIDPLKNKIVPLKKKVEELVAQVKSYQTQIDALESGIVTVIGFHVDDLVRKVIEPTGKTDANGRPIKITKYIPTDIVAYDEQHKEFVVTIPDENENGQPAEQTETPEAPTEVESETSEVNDASFLDA